MFCCCRRHQTVIKALSCNEMISGLFDIYKSVGITLSCNNVMCTCIVCVWCLSRMWLKRITSSIEIITSVLTFYVQIRQKTYILMLSERLLANNRKKNLSYDNPSFCVLLTDTCLEYVMGRSSICDHAIAYSLETASLYLLRNNH